LNSPDCSAVEISRISSSKQLAFAVAYQHAAHFLARQAAPFQPLPALAHQWAAAPFLQQQQDEAQQLGHGQRYWPALPQQREMAGGQYAATGQPQQQGQAPPVVGTQAALHGGRIG
jgi:hypothetical protein